MGSCSQSPGIDSPRIGADEGETLGDALLNAQLERVEAALADGLGIPGRAAGS